MSKPINSVAENLDAQLRALYAEIERRQAEIDQLRTRERNILGALRTKLQMANPVSNTTDLVAQLRVGEMCTPPCRTMEARSGCLCAAAADEIERLRAREAHLLDIIRCYNSDDALFDHEKVVSDVISAMRKETCK